jgi:hypothetical protein
VLNSLLSVESIRGFYVIGSTRIKLLDTLLIMVVLGSIGGPLAHMAVKRFFKKHREQREADRIAAMAATDGRSQTPPVPGDRRNSDNKPT